MAFHSQEEDEPVKFILLAEFDIDTGATLAHQYPFPTGTDDHILAELMLPDGAHLRPEDWTIFYLNQTSSNAVAPVLSHESPGRHLSPGLGTTAATGILDDAGAALKKDERNGVDGGNSKLGELLFVLNCVRMKEDKSMRRGAMVKALAVCTSNPYIQIYKPLLLLALDEYFLDPTPTVLSRLFDSLNAISTSGRPTFSRSERIVLRSSERKDLFEEKFALSPREDLKDTEVMEDLENFLGSSPDTHSLETGEGSFGRGGTPRPPSSEYGHNTEDSAHSSGAGGTTMRSKSGSISARIRKSSRLSLKDRMDLDGRDSPSSQMSVGQALGMGRPGGESVHESQGVEGMKKAVKDTHFYETVAKFKGMNIPIRIPLATFEEEVGDYSLINLVQTFSPANPVPFAAPFHPHLHSNGAQTHPIILLLNGILTQKRILFLGHGQPAGNVANLVLAACSLTGQVLRGFAERAFPYSNLAGLDMLEETPGFIAGVTNPRFEDLASRWDILCNMETGRITVSKEIGKEDPYGRSRSPSQSIQSLDGSLVKLREDEDSPLHVGVGSGKLDHGQRAESDNMFMEEILSAIQSHLGESVIRARFAEYTLRFVRLAARYEQDVLGSTKIGFPSRGASQGMLGSGVMFPDETSKAREMALNASRIDGWRRSRSYNYWKADFQTSLDTRAIKGFDLQHQLSRLRNAKDMPDAEAEMIFRTLSTSIKSYEQVVELLSHLPPHLGGLMPLALGLFHRADAAKNAVIDLLDTLQHFPIGRSATQSLNAFQRFAYFRLSEEKAEAIEALRQYRLRNRKDSTRSSQQGTIASQQGIGMTPPMESIPA